MLVLVGGLVDGLVGWLVMVVVVDDVDIARMSVRQVGQLVLCLCVFPVWLVVAQSVRSVWMRFLATTAAGERPLTIIVDAGKITTKKSYL